MELMETIFLFIIRPYAALRSRWGKVDGRKSARLYIHCIVVKCCMVYSRENGLFISISCLHTVLAQFGNSNIIFYRMASCFQPVVLGADRVSDRDILPMFVRWNHWRWGLLETVCRIRVCHCFGNVWYFLYFVKMSIRYEEIELELPFINVTM